MADRNFLTHVTVNGTPLAKLYGGGRHIYVSTTEPADLANGDIWINPNDQAAASGTPLSDAVALALGTAAAGTATSASRADHVHPKTGMVNSVGSNGPTNISAGPTATPPATPELGDLHVETDLDYRIMRWNGAAWSQVGVTYPNTLPQALGTASAGTTLLPARVDHVHAMPTAADVGAATTTHAHTTRYERWSYKGTVAIATGAMRLQFPAGATILGWSATVDTAPTGSGIGVRLNLNGTVLDSGSIAATANDMTERTLSQAMVATDYLTVDVTSVGSTVAGADLVITVRYSG